MALSNIAITLQRVYKNWRGEKEGLQREITQIEADYATLNVKRERIARMTQLLESVELVMSEVAPKWDPSVQKGTAVHTYKHMFPIGEITRVTMDKLRTSTHPLRIREITDHVVQVKGVDPTDKDLVDRVYRAVDGNLRSMRKRGRVAATDDFAARWYIVGREDQTPKP